jgi:two-component system C4-dicarboxylate transport sensor histidine kinase DctB
VSSRDNTEKYPDGGATGALTLPVERDRSRSTWRGAALRTRAAAPSLILWAIALGLLCATLVLAYQWAERTSTEVLRQRMTHRLDLYTAGLEGELGRYDYLPAILPLDQNVIDLLRRPDAADLIDRVNRYLEQLNLKAQSTAIFILDTNGDTVAASNWNEPDSFVGMALSYRPYFTDALRYGSGRFYGIGTTSGQPGYYFAHVIRDKGQLLGVAAVKVSLDRVEATWAPGSDRVFVTDANDVVILTSAPEWKFRATGDLSGETLTRLNATRQYDRVKLERLRFEERRRLSDSSRLVTVAEGTDLRDFLALSKDLAETGWRITMLSDLEEVRVTARTTSSLAGLGYGCAILLALYLRQRRHVLRQKLAAREDLQRAHDFLERRVETRTADLLSANTRLLQEIEERRRAERELREALGKLVQAGKLAVLGQMATGITHELNQPLATLRLLAANTAVFLQRAQPAQVEDNLKIMVDVIDRMGRITGQLRTFAHKSPVPPEAVPLHRCIGNALFLLNEQLRKFGVNVDLSEVPEDSMVVADGHRLDQVLVNLFGNAIDAMANALERRLAVMVAEQDGRVLIRVRDTGTGISEAASPHLFEPFFTTKQAGKGLGLGLVISAAIVGEFGGTLRAGNVPGGGAQFIIDLPAASPPGTTENEGAKPCRTA